MYRPTAGAKGLGVSAPSAFLAAMSNAFGTGAPYTLGEGSIPILRAMAAVYSHDDNPYQKLIDIIEKCSEIEVWSEY